MNNRIMMLPFSQSFGSLSNICQLVWQDLQVSLFQGQTVFFFFLSQSIRLETVNKTWRFGQCKKKKVVVKLILLLVSWCSLRYVIRCILQRLAWYWL